MHLLFCYTAHGNPHSGHPAACVVPAGCDEVLLAEASRRFGVEIPFGGPTSTATAAVRGKQPPRLRRRARKVSAGGSEAARSHNHDCKAAAFSSVAATAPGTERRCRTARFGLPPPQYRVRVARQMGDPPKSPCFATRLIVIGATNLADIGPAFCLGHSRDRCLKQETPQKASPVGRCRASAGKARDDAHVRLGSGGHAGVDYDVRSREGDGSENRLLNSPPRGEAIWIDAAFCLVRARLPAARHFPAPAISQGIREFKMATSWPKGLPGLGSSAERIGRAITSRDRQAHPGDGVRRR